jgi:two-component system response regulator AtoC
MSESNGYPTVLVVDRDAQIRKLVSEILHYLRKDVRIEERSDPLTALPPVGRSGPSLVILGAATPVRSCLARVRGFRREGNGVPILLMCVRAPKPEGVAGLASLQVLMKPFGFEEFRVALDAALPKSDDQNLTHGDSPSPDVPERRESAPTNGDVNPSPPRDPGHGSPPPCQTGSDEGIILGRSLAMRSVIDSVGKVAPAGSTVLLVGPTGSGKTTMARLIHQLSPRQLGPFVKVSSGALPETLLESELFGHEKGAFTGAESSRPGNFELADGGTLFLDDVANLSHSAQSKLLGVVEEKAFRRLGGTKTLHVDVRLVAATSKDLKQLFKQGEFMEDLYWRLRVVEIKLPALTDRREDIPILVETFVKRFGKRYGKEGLGVPGPLLDALVRHSWPGNIRELQNVVEGLVVLASGGGLEMKDLPQDFGEAIVPGDNKNGRSDWGNGGIPLEAVLEALKKSAGNRTLARKFLGISHGHLYRLLNQFRLI